MNKEEREWYAIHTYSGHENKVKINLKQRIKATGMEEKIFEILIPTEDKVKMKDDKKTVKEEKIYPGYVLIEMIMDDDSWYVVRNTPGVIGFASAGNNPVPVNETEMRSVLRDMDIDVPKPDIGFEEGDEVEVTSGPFKEHIGTVEEIDYDKQKVTVLVAMFGGRETPLELDFYEVKKN